MKRQDRRAIAHSGLTDSFELREEEEFGGVIQHGELRHALRIFRDRRTRVIRLEASALRGHMKDVPIWTAFITRYLGDPDWIEDEGHGVVSFLPPRPPPYVFLQDYELPRAPNGRDYVLRFTTSSGESMSFSLPRTHYNTNLWHRCAELHGDMAHLVQSCSITRSGYFWYDHATLSGDL